MLQLLAMGKKTGCLTVTHRNNFGYIYFDKGRICYASIVNRRDRLGDILVKSGTITQAQLDAAIALQDRRRDKRLGEMLVEQGAMTRERAARRRSSVQIEEAVYFLFTWTQGTFNFEADVRPEEQDFLVSINPESLLLEGARRVDEWSLDREEDPVVRHRVRRRSREASPTSDAELNDGAARCARRWSTAARRPGDHRRIGARRVRGRQGAVRPGDRRLRASRRQVAARRTSPLAEARVEEHRNLGIAFYKTGMLDEALREFRRVLELREQRSGGALLPRSRARAAANSGTTRSRRSRKRPQQPGAQRAVFHNLAYALEQQGRSRKRASRSTKRCERGGDRDPRVQTSLGVARAA